jgi:hypothetical protein
VGLDTGPFLNSVNINVHCASRTSRASTSCHVRYLSKLLAHFEAVDAIENVELSAHLWSAITDYSAPRVRVHALHHIEQRQSCQKRNPLLKQQHRHRSHIRARLYEPCESCTKEISHLSSYVQSASSFGPGGHIADGRLLLARLRVGVREDTLGFQPSTGLLESPCLNAAQCQPCAYGTTTSSAMSLPHASQLEPLFVLLVHSCGPFHVPSVRLERVCYSCQSEAAIEPPVPDTFPPLLLVLLARLNAKQPAGRRIVARAVAALRAL